MRFTPSDVGFLEELDSIYSEEGEIEIPLDANQMLLRGSSLRNTDYIYGIVVYTGHERKIMKNSPKSRTKKSYIEVKVNYFIIITFCFMILICLFASLYSAIWNNAFSKETNIYLAWDLSDDPISNSVLLTFLFSFGTWLLIFW